MSLLKKTKNSLYGITRTTGKIASTLHDIDTITSGNPKKIVKRFKNKAIRKTTYGLLNKLLK